jgi:hypothetical protein
MQVQMQEDTLTFAPHDRQGILCEDNGRYCTEMGHHAGAS